jgi:hypothetical protein
MRPFARGNASLDKSLSIGRVENTRQELRDRLQSESRTTNIPSNNRTSLQSDWSEVLIALIGRSLIVVNQSEMVCRGHVSDIVRTRSVSTTVSVQSSFRSVQFPFSPVSERSHSPYRLQLLPSGEWIRFAYICREQHWSPGAPECQPLQKSLASRTVLRSCPSVARLY